MRKRTRPVLGRNIEDFPESHQETLAKARKRHPDKVTKCGALLAEITSPTASINERWLATDLYGLFCYKRGLRTFDAIASEVYADIVAKWDEDDWSVTSSERFFFDTLMHAIAAIDSPESHSTLLRYLDSVEIDLLRATVIDAMSREGREFDAELIFKILEEETKEKFILSGLHVLKFHSSYIVDETLRSHVSPFLKHESAWVRGYAVEVLMFEKGSLEAIKELSDDPDAEVRRTVATAIRYSEEEKCESLIDHLLEGPNQDDVKTINELIALGCTEDTDLLFSDFANETTERQLSIVFSMRIIANAKARTILAKLLAGSSVEVPVRAALTEIVGGLGMTDCKKLIIDQLGHSAPEVRFWSCEALGFIGQRDDLDRLRALLDDRAVGYLEETVANAAEQAIEFIESK